MKINDTIGVLLGCRPERKVLSIEPEQSVYEALQMLGDAGVLVPLTSGKRNQAWEPAGLLNLIAQLEAGELADT